MCSPHRLGSQEFPAAPVRSISNEAWSSVSLGSEDPRRQACQLPLEDVGLFHFDRSGPWFAPQVGQASIDHTAWQMRSVTTILAIMYARVLTLYI
jgi:hypothetical protein